MDIDMPGGMGGIEASRRALERWPDLKIIALSMHGEPEFYLPMVEAGVKGFVLKDSDFAEVSAAATAVAGGGTHFPQGFAQTGHGFVPMGHGFAPTGQDLAPMGQDFAGGGTHFPQGFVQTGRGSAAAVATTHNLMPDPQHRTGQPLDLSSEHMPPRAAKMPNAQPRAGQPLDAPPRTAQTSTGSTPVEREAEHAPHPKWLPTAEPISEREAAEPLSEREAEVLPLVCGGLSNQQIADRLFISKRTVDKHRANILAKTGCRNTASLVVYALRNGLVEV
jgi:DNA-binding NarL/FixJ family response regulator